MDNEVIIIGGNHHNTLGVIRALGQKGLKDKMSLIIESNGDDFVSKSKYMSKKRVHRISSDIQIPTILKKFSSNLPSKPIVICCNDQSIAAIDKCYDELKSYCILPNAKETEGLISYYLNKENQAELAAKSGILTPSYISLNIKDISREFVKLPCIIKPINSILGQKSDIEICFNDNDLKDYIIRHNKGGLVKIEEYIEKEFEFQLIGCALKQVIIIPGYTVLIRQPKNTNTGYLRYNPLPDRHIPESLINSVKDYIRKIGYWGLFSVEFLRGKDGKDYFLEINMRNDGNAYCVTTAGINLPFIWYKFADNPGAEMEELITFSKPIYWMPERDVKNIRSIGIFNWLKQWFCADSHGVTAINDLKPIIYMVYSKIKNILNH